ncbi:Uncharacterized protein Fot_09923 [Forsythia ovata]|uniref:Uncharacterized protein n=1 Tax=Forsythia ovata TaxID=205694 RepID=A0ABD1WHX6_9LAMI
MGSSRSGSKSRRKTKKRRNVLGSKRNRGLNSGTAKPVKKKVNIPVPERQTLKAAKIVAQVEEKQQHYSNGLYDDSLVLRVEDSDVEFASPLIHHPPSKPKKHAGDSSSSQTIIEVVQNMQTVTVDCHLNLEKMTGNLSSHVININAKSVEEEGDHHKSSDNEFENAVKNIHNLTNFANNGFAEKLHKKECWFSKKSIMRNINELKSKHEQLVFDQFKMKMEIYNLFTDFAKSIIDGIEAVSSLIVVGQMDYIAPPQHVMQNYENHISSIASLICVSVFVYDIDISGSY